MIVVRTFGRSSSVSHKARAAAPSETAAVAGGAPQQLQRRLAEAALGHVDDPLEREVVVRLMHHAQIGDGVADLGALVEPRAADHPVRQPEVDEPLLERAGLEAGAHQHRDVAERRAPRAAPPRSPRRRSALPPRRPKAPRCGRARPASPSVHSVLPRRERLCAIRPEAAPRMCPVER